MTAAARFRKIDFVNSYVLCFCGTRRSRSLDFASHYFRYSVTSRMTSSSIGMPRGRLATPMTSRTGNVLVAKDISKQIRGCVRDPGLVEEVPGCRYEDSEPDDARHSIE